MDTIVLPALSLSVTPTRGGSGMDFIKTDKYTISIEEGGAYATVQIGGETPLTFNEVYQLRQDLQASLFRLQKPKDKLEVPSGRTK